MSHTGKELVSPVSHTGSYRLRAGQSCVSSRLIQVKSRSVLSLRKDHTGKEQVRPESHTGSHR